MKLSSAWSQLNPRTKGLLTTAATGYLARLASAMSLIITVPWARSVMAPDAFGVWMMLSTLLAFFAFADLGVGNGVLNRLSAAQAEQDAGTCGRILKAGYACTAGSGLLLLGAWGLWATLSSQPLGFLGIIPAAISEETLLAFSIFLGLLAINLPAALVQKAQLAFHDGAWVGAAQGAAALSALAFVPLALHLSPSLPLLVLASMGGQVLINIISSCWWLYRRRSQFAWSDRSRSLSTGAIDLLRLGFWFFLLQLCAALAFQSDAFVIGNLLGQAAYGDYAAYQRVFVAAASFAVAGLVGLWPAFGDALQRGDIKWARATLKRSLWTASAVMMLLGVALNLSMGWLSEHWLRAPMPPFQLPLLLATWSLVESLGLIAGNLLNSANIVRQQVVVAILMASCAFALKWLLVHKLGSWGAVLATLIAYLAISVPALVYLLQVALRPPLANQPGSGNCPKP